MNRAIVSRADVRRIERPEYTLWRVTMESHDGEDGWSIEYESDFVYEEEAQALAQAWREHPGIVRLCANLHHGRMPLHVDEWQALVKRAIGEPVEGYLDFSCRFFAWLEYEQMRENANTREWVDAFQTGIRGRSTWDDVAEGLQANADAGERWLEEQVLVFTGSPVA